MAFWSSFFSKKTKVDSQFSIKIFNLIGFKPQNELFYEEAFTHRSFCHDLKNDQCNFERLEFLGDAILGSVVAEFLFHKAPNKKEGYLTQMRSKIVNRKNLNEVAKRLNLISIIRFNKKSILSEDVHGDVYEALIGAIFLDYGRDKCKEFIDRTILKFQPIENLEKKVTSYKSLLLEWTQKNKVEINFNTFEEENAQDITVFVCIIRFSNKVIAKGRDTSKKKAEENASRRAYYSTIKK